MTKRQVRLKRVKKPRDQRKVIISFRLRSQEAELLQRDYDTIRGPGIGSLKRYARMLVVDYALGKLAYVNPELRQADPDVRQASRSFDEANKVPGPITDAEFLRQLSGFLSVPGNWIKLRLLLIGTGWPPRFQKQLKGAANNGVRAQITRKVIDHLLGTRT